MILASRLGPDRREAPLLHSVHLQADEQFTPANEKLVGTC